MARVPAIILSLLAVGAALAQPAPPPAWIVQSNEFAQIPLAVFARYDPENAAQLGVAGVDNDVFDLRPKVYERHLEDNRNTVATLRAKLATVEDPRVRQDLEIMIKSREDAITTAQLRRRLLLEFIDVGQIEFEGIRSLLDPQIPKERQAAALVRLRRYAGVEPGNAPLTQLAIDRTSERLPVPGLTGPYVNQVNKALGDTDHYVAGMRDLFSKSDL